MIDQYKEFRDRLNPKNYEYEGSANFLEEELLKRELKALKEQDSKPKQVRAQGEKVPYSDTIQESVDELFLR